MIGRYVPQVSSRSRCQIEEEAICIIEEFYPELLVQPGRFPVLDFFDHHLRDQYGLDPGVKELSDGVEGVTCPDGRVFLSEATYRRASQGEGRARFTVLHECYHGIRHRAEVRNRLIHMEKLVLYRRSSIPAYRDPEWQANVFASASLMPATMVRMLAESVHRMLLVSEMCGVFGVSAQAAQIRLEQMGI